MMANFYAVLDILECNYAIAELLSGFSRWEKMLQYLYDSQTQRCGKTFEDKMWIGLAHCTTLIIGNVGS